MNELENYIVETGEGGTKYKIPSGVLGNDTGSSVSFILPNDYNSQTNITGYIEGEVNQYVSKGSWADVSSKILNANNSSIVVGLDNGSFGQQAQKINAQSNLAKLDYVYNLVGGNNEDVTLYGASNGTVFAISTAAENKCGNYDISVKEVVVADYYDSHNRSKISLDSLATLAANDVSITAITDSENTNNTVTGVRKLLIDYSKLGGKSLLGEFEGSGYSHEYKCIEPINRGILGFISGDNDLQEGEKNIIFTQYLNGEKSNTSLSYDETKKIFNNLGSSNGSMVSVEYQFIISKMNSLNEAIYGSNFLELGNMSTSTNGSFTLSSVMSVFNNYSSNSMQFLTSLSSMRNNILMIAQSYSILDSSLAETINSVAVNNINNIDLTDINKFLNVPFANDISDSNGYVSINRESLSGFLSDSNYFISSLLNDISDMRNIKSVIDSFSSESINKLQGEEWDIIRSKCTEFSELCDKKINYAQSLINGIRDACKKLLEYLEDYDELDTSKIPLFEQDLDNTKKEIEILQNLIAQLEAAEGTYEGEDVDGNYYSYTIDNSDEIAECEEQIGICRDIVDELTRILEKLYGLTGVDKSASSIIEMAENENKTDNLSVTSL